MDLQDAIALIKHPTGITGTPAIWADLGCGTGTFTYALAHLLEAGSTIYALDKTFPVLANLPKPPQVHLQPGQLDFLKEDLPISGLHGILMANSLHYVAHKPTLINKLKPHLQNNGQFLIVEYDTSRSNPWVPYPVPFPALKELFQEAGFATAVKLQERPSLYRSGKMYAALFSR